MSAEPGRGPWRRFRAALDAAGFHPSRRLGQNFLLDENMARAIVRDARIGSGHRVLEVGAGCGFLTYHLARAGADVVAVEIDPRLCAIARELCAGAGRVRFVEGDVLAGKHRLAPEVRAALPEAPWHLVASLPYSIAAPLLTVLAGSDRRPADGAPDEPTGATRPQTMTFLVQLEVAERIAARPGTRARGPLSVRLQLEHDVELLRRVPAELFWPRPRVESALVRLTRRATGPEPLLRAALDELVGTLFQRRRQAIGRVLGERLGDRALARERLARLGIDPARRPETLELEEFLALAAAGPWDP